MYKEYGTVTVPSFTVQTVRYSYCTVIYCTNSTVLLLYYDSLYNSTVLLLYCHILFKQYGIVTVPPFNVQTVRLCYCTAIHCTKNTVLLLYRHSLYKEYGNVTVLPFPVQRVRYCYCTAINSTKRTILLLYCHLL